MAYIVTLHKLHVIRNNFWMVFTCDNMILVLLLYTLQCEQRFQYGVKYVFTCWRNFCANVQTNNIPLEK